MHLVPPTSRPIELCSELVSGRVPDRRECSLDVTECDPGRAATRLGSGSDAPIATLEPNPPFDRGFADVELTSHLRVAAAVRVNDSETAVARI